MDREVYWRPLDSRFSRLETRLLQHRKWLEKETRNHVQPYAEIEQHRVQYVEFVRHQSDLGHSDRTLNDNGRIERRLKRVEKLCALFSGQFSLDGTNQSVTSAFPQSCDWFLKDSMYRHWKDGAFQSDQMNNRSALASTWQHRILFVQGK